MTRSASSDMEIALEVGKVASAGGSVRERGGALLEILAKRIPFDAAWIGLSVPPGNQYVTEISHGIDSVTTTCLERPQLMTAVGVRGAHPTHLSVSSDNLPVPGELGIWAKCLRPAGLLGGIGTCLFAADDRYVGYFMLPTQSANPPVNGAPELLGALSRVIANMVDPMRELRAVARVVQDAQAGAVLTCSAHTLPLPGLAEHPVLTRASQVFTVAGRLLADGQVWGHFLWPYGGTRTGAGYVKITVLAAPSTAPPLFACTVLVSPAGDRYGLTPRELQVLGRLVDGLSNPQIAQSLCVAERTVATHIEHILTKLGVASRALAAARASREGLYLPSEAGVDAVY